jgi:hypothetical protein
LIYATSFAIGRAAFVLAGVALALSIVFGDPGPAGRKPQELLFAVSVLFGALWIVGITAAVALAFTLRCDTCGRRQVLWHNAPPKEYQSFSARPAFVRWIYTDELRDRRFNCPHCSAEYHFGGRAHAA